MSQHQAGHIPVNADEARELVKEHHDRFQRTLSQYHHRAHMSFMEMDFTELPPHLQETVNRDNTIEYTAVVDLLTDVMNYVSAHPGMSWATMVQLAHSWAVEQRQWMAAFLIWDHPSVDFGENNSRIYLDASGEGGL